ncbi:hypothetical protein C8J57DRAFT_1652341 [Mycena rebaudengoi]|nr:hypothetical protein C8J57DRAFT_1652341 [Mycena rebaudengoi]
MRPYHLQSPPHYPRHPPRNVYAMTPTNYYIYSALWACPVGSETSNIDGMKANFKLHAFLVFLAVLSVSSAVCYFRRCRHWSPRAIPTPTDTMIVELAPDERPRAQHTPKVEQTLMKGTVPECLGQAETLPCLRCAPLSSSNPVSGPQQLPAVQLLPPEPSSALLESVLGVATDPLMPSPSVCPEGGSLESLPGRDEQMRHVEDTSRANKGTPLSVNPQIPGAVAVPPQAASPRLSSSSPVAASPHRTPKLIVHVGSSCLRSSSCRSGATPRRGPSTPAPDDLARQPFRFESGPQPIPKPIPAPPLPTPAQGTWKMKFTPLRPSASKPARMSPLVRERNDVPAPPTPGPAETTPTHVASPAAVERMSPTATPAPPTSTPVETAISLSPTSTSGPALAPVPSDSRDFFVSLAIRYEHWGGRRASPYRIPSPSQRTAWRGSPAPTPTPAARTKSRPAAIALAPPSPDPFVVVSVATADPGGFELHSPPKSRSSRTRVAPTPTRPPRVLAAGVEGPSPTHAEPSSTPQGSPPQALRVRPAPSRLVVPPAARLAPPRLPAPAPTAPTCHGQRHYPYPTPPRPQQLPPTPNRAHAAQSPVAPTSVTCKLVGRVRAWRETPMDAEEEIAAELVRHGALGRANPDEYSVVAGWQATTVTLMRSTRLRGGEAVAVADVAVAMPQMTIQDGSGAGMAGLGRAARPVSRLPVRKGKGKATAPK